MDRRELFKEYGTELDRLCEKRLEAGEEEYGALQFLGADGASWEMVLEEIADSINWLRLLYIKLRVIQDTAGDYK